MANVSNVSTITLQQVSKFNEMRSENILKQFNGRQMLNVLQDAGFPKHLAFLKAMCSGVNPPITRVKAGVYTFNPKPVYSERIQTSYDLYVQLRNPNKKQELNEQKCIEFLKEKGYKIYKLTYEEI